MKRASERYAALRQSFGSYPAPPTCKHCAHRSADKRDQKLKEINAIRKRRQRAKRHQKRVENKARAESLKAKTAVVEDCGSILEMDLFEDNSARGAVDFHKNDSGTTENRSPKMDIEDLDLFPLTSPEETLLFGSSLVDILGEEVAGELGFLQAPATSACSESWLVDIFGEEVAGEIGLLQDHDSGALSQHTLTDLGNDHFGSAVSTTPLFRRSTASVYNSGPSLRHRRPPDSDSVEERYRERVAAVFGPPQKGSSHSRRKRLRADCVSEDFEERYRARLEAHGLNKPPTPDPEEEEINARWEQRKRLNKLRNEGFEPWMLQLAATPLNGECPNLRIPEMEKLELLHEILNSMKHTLEGGASLDKMDEDSDPTVTEGGDSDAIEELMRYDTFS
jgi:hypothetical protein